MNIIPWWHNDATWHLRWSGHASFAQLHSPMRFFYSNFAFICSIVSYCVSALTLLESNIALPKNNNLITMANATLGPVGKYLTWFVYLLTFIYCVYVLISLGATMLYMLFSFS